MKTINFKVTTYKNAEFEDSLEFTEAFADLKAVAQDPRFTHWLEITDEHMGSETANKYKQVLELLSAIDAELLNL